MVSVIVPIYNAEKTIDRCINSILLQTYRDFELLLVDDGSTDSTRTICEEYAKQDTHIRIIQKENGGVSSARNLGLCFARGEYVAFVDSDDWVGENYLSNLTSHMQNDVDIVMSYNWYITKIKQEQEQYPLGFFDAESFQQMFVSNDMHYHTAPWGKLFRKAIIDSHNLSFDEKVHIGEDLLFLYEYLLVSKFIFISSDTDYYYVADMSDSLTKRVNIISSELYTYTRVSEIVYRIFDERCISNAKAIKSLNWIIGSYVRRVLNALYQSELCRNDRLTILNQIRLEPYLECVEVSSWKESVYKILLRFRLFWCYDILRIVVNLY